MSALVRVVAPRFVAGLVFERRRGRWVCTEAAPILRRLCLGRTAQDCGRAFKRRGWKADTVARSLQGQSRPHIPTV